MLWCLVVVWRVLSIAATACGYCSLLCFVVRGVLASAGADCCCCLMWFDV